jgi:hypothetical protein
MSSSQPDATVEDVPGRDMPMASIAEDIVFAVNIPPGRGRRCHSVAENDGEISS